MFRTFFATKGIFILATGSFRHRFTFRNKAVTLISLVSYSAYLVHNTIILELIVHRIGWSEIVPVKYLNVLIKYISYLGLTLLVSILLYKYVELPLMKIRDSKWIKNGLMPKTTQ